MAKKHFFLIILLTAFIWAHSVHAGPRDWFKGVGKPKIKTLKRNVAKPLMFDQGSLTYISRHRPNDIDLIVLEVNTRELKAHQFLDTFDPSKPLVVKKSFKSSEQMISWIKSNFPEVQCQGDYGMEACPWD